MSLSLFYIRSSRDGWLRFLFHVLSLPFGKPRTLLFGDGFGALRALNTRDKQLRVLLLLCDGPSTAKAHDVFPFFESVPHRDSSVKDEAVALPKGFLWVNLLQIFEDASSQVVNLVKAHAF